MNSMGGSFFHTVVGTVLFVAAVGCLMLNTRSVILYSQMGQKNMTEGVLYEAEADEYCRIVMGDKVLLYVLTEIEADIKIRLADGTGWIIDRDGGEEHVPETLHDRIASSFWVEYEYGEDGRVKTVCFEER